MTRFSKVFSSVLATVLVWNLGAVPCFAHPDHPLQIVPGNSVLHYIVQPEHSLTLAVFAVAMWWIIRCVRTQLANRVPAKKVLQIEDRRLG